MSVLIKIENLAGHFSAIFQVTKNQKTIRYIVFLFKTFFFSFHNVFDKLSSSGVQPRFYTIIFLSFYSKFWYIFNISLFIN